MVRLFFLRFACATMPTAVGISQMLNLTYIQWLLYLIQSELAYTVILVDDGISEGIRGEEPLVVITCIRIINNAKTVCLNDPKVFKGA